MSDSNSKVVSKNAKAGAGTGARGGTNSASPAETRRAIAVLAYRYAERRNFEPGHELDDWLEAENEVLAEREGFKGFPS